VGAIERPLLGAEGLACARGGRLVFEQVSFALAPGEALLLRGPNGAGKSSLLRLLAGFLAPSAGALWWDGKPALADPAEHRVRLHLIGHGNGIKAALTVSENLRFAIAVAGGPAAPLERALAGFELSALADTPAEPDAGLDAANRTRLARAVAAHRAAGGVAVIATHRDLGLEATQVLELAP
jgi:heme exporter protein A